MAASATDGHAGSAASSEVVEIDLSAPDARPDAGTTDAGGTPAPGTAALPLGLPAAAAAGRRVVHPRWTVELDGAVTALRANRDGSVLAAATAIGTLSLLRGRDGERLAELRLDGAEDAAAAGVATPLAGPPSVAWIPRAGSTAAEDALWVEATGAQWQQPQYLLVDGVRADPPGDAAMEGADDAARGGVPSVAPLALPGDTWRAAAAFFPGFVAPGTTAARDCDEAPRRIIRIAACEEDGSLALYDYDIDAKVTRTVREKVYLRNQDDTGDDCNVDYELGMRVAVAGDKVYVLVCGTSETGTTLHWLDGDTLESACRIPLEPGQGTMSRKDTSSTKSMTKSMRPKVLAMEPLTAKSDPSRDSLTIVVAMSSASNQSIIQVVRVLYEETFGLTLLAKPHVLYEVPLQDAATGVELSASVDDDLSFCFKLWTDASTAKYFAFRPGPSSATLGRLRRLLETERFDELDQEMEQTSTAAVLRDPYAVFSVPEVLFQRLRATLSQGCIGDAAAVRRARDCLQRLAAGATDGALDFLAYLVKATNYCVHSIPDPSLAVMSFVLKAVSDTLEHVSKGVTIDASENEVLQEKLKEISHRLQAVQFLESILKDGPKLPMTDGFRAVRSPRHLFTLLVKHQHFAIAEKMWHSHLRDYLTPEVLVASLGEIPASVSPRLYVNLLTEAIFPSLTIGHELLGPVRSWVCRTADALDEVGNEHGLSAAILLLEASSRSLNRLQLRVHESFAVTSPFEDKIQFVQATNSHAPSPFEKTSRPSSARAKDRHKQLSVFRTINGGANTCPTLLQLGVINRAPVKMRFSPLLPSDERYDDDNECVASKLREARCLQRARLAGLEKYITDLRTLRERGGPQFVALQLVALLSSAADTHDARCEVLTNCLKPFCHDFNIDYESALYDYVRSQCRGKTVSKSAICESESLARCCLSMEKKSLATLSVLQSALLRGYFPDWLAELAKQAMMWASFDSELQSEIEEAWRLLSITSIVVRYCGDAAREMFRIDNPRHVTRLMDFVTQCVHVPNVLDDVHTLCDAFAHLSVRDSCSALVQHAILRGDETVCNKLMTKIFDRDFNLALSVLAETISFVEELMVDCSREIQTLSLTQNVDDETIYETRQQTISACRCACSIVAAAIKYRQNLSTNAAVRTAISFEFGSLESLRNELSRITRLQTEFSIFISISDMQSSSAIVSTMSTILADIVKAHADQKQDWILNKIAAAKRACTLIANGTPELVESFWYIACADAAVKMVKERQDEYLFAFLKNSGLLDKISGYSVARSQLSVALTLGREAVSKASGDLRECMQRLVKAAVLVRSYSLVTSKSCDLAAVASLSSIVDIACEITMRGDEGVGEDLDALRNTMEIDVWRQKLPPSLQSAVSDIRPSSCMNRPILHSQWYIGDGLLLPPKEALEQGLCVCNGLLFGNLSNTRKATEFLRVSGAQSLALRLLGSSASRFSSSIFVANRNRGTLDELVNGTYETLGFLAERSLGGLSRTGILSRIVDSELAASFILSLPPKEAVELYKMSLPIALKSQDFNRLYELAHVGCIVCRREDDPNFHLGGFFPIGWKSREKFLIPCQQLALRSMWWSVLKGYQIEFDTHRFEVTSNKIDKQYLSSLLLQLISAMSKRMETYKVLKGCNAFALAFGGTETIVLREHVRFLLTRADTIMDIQNDLSTRDKLTKRSLSMLPSPLTQCEILRECLSQLEQASEAQHDYETFSLVLSLYQDALILALDQASSMEPTKARVLEKDFDMICRRRDALSILSSFFYGIRLKDRPAFPSFFLPLDADVSKWKFCGVLGKAEETGANTFDPLSPLDGLLSNSVDLTAVASLAPMCLSLGLPAGYIHARSLIKKFIGAAVGTRKSPSFESDVMGTIERLRSPRDKAELAEWCATQYMNSDVDRLKCLDVAHTAAVLASDEIEKRRRFHPNDSRLEQAENQALTTIKRLDTNKASLSDRLRAVSVLRAGVSCSQDIPSGIVEDLIQRLNKHAHEDPFMSPDALVDFLLLNGSLLTAKACLNSENPLSIEQFRLICMSVHDACCSIADQYSHIDLSQVCKRFAYRWLFYGASSPMNLNGRGDHGSHLQVTGTIAKTLPADDDETLNFVMDLSELMILDNEFPGKEFNTEGCRPAQSFTSDEEQSAVHPLSVRERSESACQREALQIAFVLSFEQAAQSCSIVPEGVENKDPSVDGKPTEPLKKRPTLLAKIETRKNTRPEAKINGLCRWLLQIVFANSDQSSKQLCGNASFMEANDSQLQDDAQITITFAMRHRALRTAAILCPQYALERVIYEDGMLRKASGVEANVTLKECAFASFVAKEIEEMGLPLPHSDLVQLSSMDFLAYSRTLWRHHRDVAHGGQRGRLLLLLMEMSLKGKSTDIGFFTCLLEEMIRLHLPRTLLLSHERIVVFENRVDGSATLVCPALTSSIESTATAIFSETHSILGSSDATIGEKSFANSVASIRRLGDVVIGLSSTMEGQQQLQMFVNLLGDLLETVTCKDLESSLNPILVSAKRRLNLNQDEGGKEHDQNPLCLAEALSRLEGTIAFF